jgi:Chaperone of endosialidase
MVALGASPGFAQTWNPVKSDAMNNTAMGTGALTNPDLDDEGGCHNTASGADTLTEDRSGSYNTANGFGSLSRNLTGDNNTGQGAEALYSTTSGSNNTASGYQALYHNIAGAGNTALGMQALFQVTGSNNIAIGTAAGFNLTTGHSNIAIGAPGSPGESGKIRIGTEGTQTGTFIAGISGAHVTGAAVYVNSAGQLGVLASSERYKTAIVPLGSRTEKLSQLRPVSFHLKNDPKGEVQYGLIAEEVAKVYPELVIRGSNGRIEGVRYDELAPMLLNEVQKQQSTLQSLAEEVAQLRKVNEDTQAALAQMRSTERQVAAR